MHYSNIPPCQSRTFECFFKFIYLFLDHSLWSFVSFLEGPKPNHWLNYWHLISLPRARFSFAPLVWTCYRKQPPSFTRIKVNYPHTNSQGSRNLQMHDFKVSIKINIHTLSTLSAISVSMTSQGSWAVTNSRPGYKANRSITWNNFHNGDFRRSGGSSSNLWISGKGFPCVLNCSLAFLGA